MVKVHKNMWNHPETHHTPVSKLPCLFCSLIQPYKVVQENAYVYSEETNHAEGRKTSSWQSQVFRFGGDIYQSLMELMELVFRRRKMVPLVGEQWDVKVEFRIEQRQKNYQGSKDTSPKSREKSQDTILESTVKMNKEILKSIWMFPEIGVPPNHPF